MKISIGTAVLVIAAYSCSQSSAAQNLSDRSKLWVTMAEGTVPSGSSFHLRSEGGTIRVEGTSDRNITYVVSAAASGAKGVRNPAARFYKVETHLRGQDVWLTATRTEGFRKIATQFLVRVPASVKSLELEASSGAVEIGNLACRVRIHSKGGSVELANADGPVFADTSAQDINIGTVAGDGWFRTGAGRISVNRVQGNVDAWTGAGSISVNTGLRDALLRAGAGDIRIANCGGTLTVVSGGGNLLLGDLAGPADIQTNGGNVRVHSALGFVQAQTSGGNIELAAVPSANAQTGGGSIFAAFVRSREPFKDSSLRTDAGDITVYLPSDLAVTVQASVDLGSGHRITSDFPEIQVATRADALATPIVAEGRINGGGPTLKLQVMTGNISIQRASSRVQISGLVNGK